MKTIKNNFIIVKYVAKFCPFYIFSSILNIISGSLMSLSEVMVIENVINLVMEKQTSFDLILKELIIHMVTIIICLIFQRLHEGYLRTRNRQIWMKKIQHVLFEKAANLDVSCFDNPKEYDLFSRALTQGDVQGINSFDSLVRLLRSIGIILTIGTYIIFQDIILLLIAVAQAAVTLIVQSIDRKMWYKTSKEQEVNNRRYGYIRRVFYLEKYTCDIKTTNLDELLIENQDETKDIIDKGYARTENLSFMYNCMDELPYRIVNDFFVYVYLMWKVYEKIISIAIFTSTVNATFKFTNNFYRVIHNYSNIKENALYIDDFLWLMNYTPKIETKTGNRIESSHPHIQVNNVHFKYPDQENYTLNGISMELKPKEKIAIIGYNGAGKTTLIKLLLKFYNCDEGNILIDNENYLDIDEREIRSKFVSLFQNFQIYSTSVLENVLMRKKESEEDEALVWEALKKAEIYDVIKETKYGLDTIMTKEFHDDGLVLSGGQKQKLAIARIFASKAPIIILDEPTSAMDPVSEYEINNKILSLCKDKTVILISHRLSTVIDASIIYMMDNGKIIESGNHRELMSKKGKYFEMFNTQAKLYLEGDTNE